MNDEASLQAMLDARPDDWGTRLILADLLEEQGRDDEAACQRWMAAERRHPVKNGYGWTWNAALFWPNPRDEVGSIPVRLCNTMMRERYSFGVVRDYISRHAAELALSRALASLRQAHSGKT